jgi:cytochrome b subunit of formate dehydrogenase
MMLYGAYLFTVAEICTSSYNYGQKWIISRLIINLYFLLVSPYILKNLLMLHVKNLRRHDVDNIINRTLELLVMEYSIFMRINS